MTKDQIYQYFADLIYKESGIHYPAANFYQLDARLEALSKYMNVNSLKELYRTFQAGQTPEAVNYLVDLATNNETSFFRDKTPFRALVEIAKQRELNPSQPMRIWSAAASNGQESYSILIALKERVPHVFSGPGVQVLATDIKERCLERVNTGTYNHLEVQRGLPAAYLIKYFSKLKDETWQVKPELKKCITTQKLNLFTDSFPSHQMDIIFCRNVLIYQTPENKKKIIEKLEQCLRPEGYLILGSSENLLGLSQNFDRTQIEESTCYRLLSTPVQRPSQSA